MDSRAPAPADPPTPTRRLPCLVVVAGREPGRVIPLQRASLVIGRGEDAGIRIQDHGVSRRHARLHLGGGRVRLADLGSTNGTWCNGRRLEGEAVLRDGDQLRVGGSRLAFRFDRAEQAHQPRALYHRATRDPHTGLFNRASLEDRLDREVERHKRYKRGLAVIRLDIDHLDAIHRARGKTACDRVIVQVARAIRCCLRASDLVCRSGKAGFAVVLPECNLPRARAIAGKLRSRVDTLRISHANKPVPVKASLGVAVAAGASTSAGKLLAAASSDCRRARQHGGNRVGGA